MLPRALIWEVMGYPVALALGGVAILFALVGTGLGIFDPLLLTALPDRILGMMSDYTLLAIPYFILLGSLLEAVILGRAGEARGLMALPLMLRQGYQTEWATGVMAAGGTLGQMLPPNVGLLVLGQSLGVAVGDLFVGSFLPGLALLGMYIVYTLILVYFRPHQAPTVTDLPKKPILNALRAVLPPLGLIGLVVGSIFFGIATATEAGAMGCVGAAILAILAGKLSWAVGWRACEVTVRATSWVMMILMAATAFNLVLRGVQGDRFMDHFLLNLPGGRAGFLLFCMGLVFILGFFMEFWEIAFFVVPLLTPAAQQWGTDLVWFGVLLNASLQTSFLTPPLGIALFHLKSAAPPTLTMGQIYRGVMPFLGIQLVLMMLIISFPELVTVWLN